MDANSIKTNEDYNAALEEIERLMDARPETPEGDRLDVLATLIEAWEEKHFLIEAQETRRAALRQALKEGEDSGRADYLLKGLLGELDGDTP
jgi:antitoxin component HigA of HigAB toxin-antitoxin module